MCTDMKQSKALITIDDRLRLILFGLQCLMGVSFQRKAIEKIFYDSENDQVSAKQYLLCKNKSVVISGQVVEYEPESILLSISSKTIDQLKLDEIVENAQYEFYRLTPNSR